MAVIVLNSTEPTFFEDGFCTGDYEVKGRPVVKTGDSGTTFISYEIAVFQGSKKVFACLILQRVIDDSGEKIKNISEALLNLFKECSSAIIDAAKSRYGYSLTVLEPTLSYLQEQVAVSLSGLN